MHDIKTMSNAEIKEHCLKLLSFCPRLNIDHGGAGYNFDFGKWLLNSTDFFTAPASTRYHLSEEGGLARHSLNVYFRLKEYAQNYALGCTDETLIICGLLHDLCKTGYYKKSDKGYSIRDDLPLLHGYKSIFILSRLFIRLSDAEACAIAHHMGAYHTVGIYEAVKCENASSDKYPIVLALQHADQQSVKYDKL